MKIIESKMNFYVRVILILTRIIIQNLITITYRIALGKRQSIHQCLLRFSYLRVQKTARKTLTSVADPTKLFSSFFIFDDKLGHFKSNEFF